MKSNVPKRNELLGTQETSLNMLTLFLIQTRDTDLLIVIPVARMATMTKITTSMSSWATILKHPEGISRIWQMLSST